MGRGVGGVICRRVVDGWATGGQWEGEAGVEGGSSEDATLHLVSSPEHLFSTHRQSSTRLSYP